MPKNHVSPSELEFAKDQVGHQPALALFLRIFWFALGPMVAVLLLLQISRNSTGWLTGFDIAYLIVLSLLPLSRWIEFQLGNAKDVEGKSLDAAGLQQYAIIICAAGLAAWVVANVIGNYLVAQ